MSKLLYSDNSHIIYNNINTFTLTGKPDLGFLFDGLFYDESSKVFLKYIGNSRYNLEEDDVTKILQYINYIAEKPQISINDIKTNWYKKINEWRAVANQTSFTFSGKEVAVDRLSRSDLDGISSYISLYGTLPPDFPMAWKAVDNSYISIPNVDTFKSMIAAMVSQGNTNFLKSEQLKNKIKLADSQDMQNEEWLATITW